MKLRKSDLEIETIVRRILDNELDLQPDFQRGEIWDNKRRQRLVDTILRGWYIPAVHIVVDADGEEVVLDGQQRLAAIRDFLTDGIQIDGLTEPYSDDIQALAGLRFSDLPDELQRTVRRFELQVIRLSEYEPQEPNELFFRLNQSYNLTPPEKRNALHGPARNQIKDLVTELIGMKVLDKDRIGFGNARLAYDDIVARTCVAIELNDLKIHINNTIVEKYYRSGALSDSTITGVQDSARQLLNLTDSVDFRIKLNKGTLQTWLIYCFWAPRTTGALPKDLLWRFESMRQAVRRDEMSRASLTHAALPDIVRLYDDRASYRVTDVSSVRARDLAIHLYSHAEFGTSALRGSDGLLNELDASKGDGYQGSFFDFIESSLWGSPLV